MAFRFFTLTSLFGLLYGTLVFGLYRLQIEKGDFYFKRAEARLEILKELELRRGQIFFTDRNGNDIPAALNREFPVIFAVPKEVKESVMVARKLAGLLGWKEEVLAAKLANKESNFLLLYDKAPEDLVKKVTDLSLEGVYISEKQYRFYPYSKLAANVLGFVGLNKDYDEPGGLYGIEKFWNEKLRVGEDRKLTIDLNLQAESEQVLQELIEKFGAVGGAVIIQEPKTGKILALANKPDFDPNNYKDYPVKNFLNPVVQYVYEPGSVFKPLTMAIGIDLGVLTPETTFYDSGSVTLNGETIRNWDKKAHGRITMTNVIEQSVNTGAVFAENQIGHKNFYEYLRKFGFGEKLGIDLPNEVNGSLRNLENKNARAIDFATVSFGQGVAVTPIQVITAFSSLANGGLLMKPFVLRETAPQVIRRVIKEETAAKVVKMMESAVEKAGVAAIPNYRVAGKTGTAFIPDLKRGGYGDELIHTYIGFLPASSPSLTIMIKLDKPKAELAGLTVVPAFRELAEFALNYLNIPPDKL
jgi:cell division protein FtsI/penicillin-binding protein 2